MTIEQKIIAGLSTVILVGCSFAGFETLKAHDANLVAGEQQKAADAVKAEKDKSIADRDAMLATYQQQLSKQQAAVKTSAQAVQVIEHYVPAAASQQPVVVQRQDLTPEEQGKLPDAPSYVVTTQQQAVDTAKILLQCDATNAALTTCKADLADTQAKETAAEQSAATWEKAAKGGSKWARVWAATRYVLIGGAIVAGVGYAAHK